MTSQEQTPLPCPFCGSAPIIENKGSVGGGWYVRCICIVAPSVCDLRHEIALEFWNRRFSLEGETTTKSQHVRQKITDYVESLAHLEVPNALLIPILDWMNGRSPEGETTGPTAQWQRCPICEGRGVVQFNPSLPTSTTQTSGGPWPCPTCDGLRIIQVLGVSAAEDTKRLDWLAQRGIWRLTDGFALSQLYYNGEFTLREAIDAAMSAGEVKHVSERSYSSAATRMRTVLRFMRSATTAPSGGAYLTCPAGRR